MAKGRICQCPAGIAAPSIVIASEARQSRWGTSLLRRPSSDGLPRNDGQQSLASRWLKADSC